MDGIGTKKTYKPLKIPHARTQESTGSTPHQKESCSNALTSVDMYYEIEYDACPIPGVGKYVLKTQKLREPEKDAIRDLFSQMRDIARAYRSTYSASNYSRFYDKRTHSMNSAIFYKQALFMKDFTDDYEGDASFSQYFPYYQSMEYEQLRTYFSWRTKVRKGEVSMTSLSYAFLYLYELIGNIGIQDPNDGLAKIVSFWKSYRVHDATIDQYVLRWLKDYHIYYKLSHSFSDFIELHHLQDQYPSVVTTLDNFDLYCALSKYDIKKSIFFTDDTETMITECFYHVLHKLKQTSTEYGISFDESLFRPTKKISLWMPFKDALFHPSAEQSDRIVVLSEHEIYFHSQKEWFCSTVLTGEPGRQLIGFLMKHMEAVLRSVMNFKYKLTANSSNTVSHPVASALHEAGSSLEEIISKATLEFYRETTKTVVRVDPGTLSCIRKEALETQEKLIVPEHVSSIQSKVPEQVSTLKLKVPQQMRTEQISDTLSVEQGSDALPVAQIPDTLSVEQGSDALPVAQIPVPPNLLLAQEKVAPNLLGQQELALHDLPSEKEQTPCFHSLESIQSLPSEEAMHGVLPPKNEYVPSLHFESIKQPFSQPEDSLSAAPYATRDVPHNIKNEPVTIPDMWEVLKGSLSEIEKEALLIVMQSERKLKEFADQCGVMKEVLIDTINEKAMDTIGDSLLDEDCVLYEDYRKQVKELMR